MPKYQLKQPWNPGKIETLNVDIFVVLVTCYVTCVNALDFLQWFSQTSLFLFPIKLVKYTL